MTAFTTWFNSNFGAMSGPGGPKKKKKIRIITIIIIILSLMSEKLNNDNDIPDYEAAVNALTVLLNSGMLNVDDTSWSLSQQNAWSAFETFESSFVIGGAAFDIESLPTGSSFGTLVEEFVDDLTTAGII